MADGAARHRRLVERVSSHEDAMRALSDSQLRDKTREFRERLDRGEQLDHLLPRRSRR